MTEACLRAIKFNTNTPYRIILIDNGSITDFQHKYLENSDIYIKLDKNYGLEQAKNIGMKFVESELFVSTDNDILVYKYDPDWLSQLVGLMEKYPDYGAIAPHPQILVGTGMYLFETDKEVIEFPHVPGYMRIMRTDLVKRTGAWNEKRPLRGHEELWIGGKFRELGYKMGWANFVKCWHLFGKEDTDEWGYPKGMKSEEHGHNPVWPMPKNDLEIIKKEVGIDL